MLAMQSFVLSCKSSLYLSFIGVPATKKQDAMTYTQYFSTQFKLDCLLKCLDLVGTSSVLSVRKYQCLYVNVQ